MLGIICLVVAISDGDTLTARCGDPGQHHQVKVRIAAIDAPERRQDYGNRARQELAALCFQQSARIMERGRDRYGRTVADVECRGQDTASWMVRHGWAMVYTKYASQHQHLVPLQAAAHDERTGQWRLLDEGREPVPPWEWRHLRNR